MRLTLHTDYSLRVLMYLGVSGSRFVTIKEIADCYGISKNHLMKVVHHMSQMGYIETVRGKKGGLRLALDPEAISLGALIRKTEPDMAVVECFMNRSGCRLEPGCRLSGILGEALNAFLSVLDEHTLSDLLANKKGLSSLLEVDYTESTAAH